MAFGFGAMGGALGGSGSQAHAGPDLEEIQTEALGFLSIAGESKLRLLPTPWPTNALPPPTASLISVASKKGLVAAAGPESLVVATTDAVRQAFSVNTEAQNHVKPFTPQLTIPIPRVSQVSFSSDENFLVIAAESGGGLAVYDVQSILQGSKESTFQLATNGVSVRALVPNPSTEFAEFFSVVLMSGQLLLANLKERQLVRGSNGSVLKEDVSCVSWSAKGKQLVAGLGNGLAAQMTPDGVQKAEIPYPPQLGSNHHVSTIFWLANDDFLTVHTPNSFSGDSAPDSTFHLVHREKGSSNYSFHKLADPCPPFGMNRSPPHHFIARLRDFPPSLNDMLIVAATTAGDVGLFTRSETPLVGNVASDKITNTYTTTTMAIDSRRAQLPVTEEMTDTSPIGMAMDLSSKEKVPKPIPTEEMDESPSPLPNLLLLNNEGVLCSWWVVYNESIRQGTVYPGLVAAGGASATPTANRTGSQPSAFGAVAPASQSTPFGGGFGKPLQPAFGTPGMSGAGSSFGGPSALGANKSPWNAAGGSMGTASTGGAAFGKPAFGSATPLGAAAGNAFGATGNVGNKTSLWGSSPNSKQSESGGFAKPAAPFGGSAPASTPFASFGNNAGAGSPFASLSTNKAPSASPFSALGQKTQAGGSPFAALGSSNSTPVPSFGRTPEPSFGSTVTIDSSTGGSTLGSAKSIFGSPLANNNSAQRSFLSSVGGTDTAKSQETSTTSEMVDAEDHALKEKPKEAETSKGGLFGLGPGGFNLGSTFKGDGSAKDDAPKPKADAAGSLFGSGFGKALGETEAPAPVTPIKKEPGLDDVPRITEISTTPATPPRPADASNPSLATPAQDQAKVSEATAEAENALVEPEPAPLPPSPKQVKAGQKAKPIELPPLAASPHPRVEELSSPLSSLDEVEEGEIPEDTGEVVIPEDAPLPPDPYASAKKPESRQVELAKRIEQTSPRFPASESVSGTFMARSIPFEFPKGPVLPPPTSRLQESPRSPSPVRSASTPIGRPLAVPASKPISRPISRGPPVEQPLEPSDLSDDEDERIREELASEPEPTKRLEPFIAHQDYAGRVDKPGIAGQIERVYRDINSMLDTLGLNARSLTAFIKGHSELNNSNERTVDDLEDPDSWCLIELEDLDVIEGLLSESLEGGRIAEPKVELAYLAKTLRELRRRRTALIELRRQIDLYRDPKQLASQRVAPLPAEHASQQRTLRREFAAMQKRLAEAEEALTVLCAQLANHASRAGADKAGGTATPTVEAVTNTIRKMTAMAEKKSGDIDVLETQLRRLRVFSPSSNGDDGRDDRLASASASSSVRALDRASRENTPFMTPRSRIMGPPSSAGARSTGTTYGLFYTPESSFHGSPSIRRSLVLAQQSTANGAGAESEDGISGVQDENREIRALYRERAARRRAVGEKLRAAVLKRGVKVTEVGAK